MTKRILAAFLAVMMVVGLLPTTVFAADNGTCAVVDQYFVHSKEHCAKAGVGYEEVKDSTVEPACGQDGYTLYQCDCGEYFADDIIPMDDHVLGTVKAERVDPTCYALGKAAIFTCATCGSDYYDPDDQDADADGNIAKVPHTCDQVSYPGNDCTASEKVCQTPGCGYKDVNHKPAEDHVWDYTKGNVLEAPTAHDEGLIEFACTNDGCAQKKTVEILALDHMSTMVWVAEIPTGATCTSTGVYGHYHCTVCEKNYIEVPGIGLVEVSDEELIIPAVGHSWNPDPVIVHATCTTWGFKFYGCTKCSETDITEKQAPLGHTTYEQAVAHDADEDLVAVDGLWITTTPGTCTVATKYEWTCHNVDANKDGNPVCGIARDHSDPVPGHVEVELTVPASCKNEENYVITYCVSDICDVAAVTEFEKDGKTYDVSVEVVDGNVYDNDEAVKCLDIEVVDPPVETGAHFFVTELINPSTCTEPGKIFYYCEICNEHSELDTEPNGHVYDDTTTDIEAGCYNDAVQFCDVCNEPNVLYGTAHHVMSDEIAYTTYPNCQGAIGYDWYECTVPGCGYEEPENPTLFVENISYNTKAEAEREHTLAIGYYTDENGDPADYDVFREGDCVTYGYWEGHCADCDKNFLVLKEDTGIGHQRPDGTVYHPEATCTQFQGWDAYVCTKCNKDVDAEVELPALNHVTTKHDAVEATCEAGGNEEYYTCARECCAGIIYKDRNGEEKWLNNEHLIDALGHNYSETRVPVTCETEGYVHHICLNCDDEYVDGYEAALGHTKGDKEYLAPNCTEDGYENYKCGRDDCNGYYSKKELAATGHQNKAGETLVEVCTNKYEDRLCVNKNCPDADKIIEQPHDIVSETVNAHCCNYGYVMETCANGCGEKDKVIDVVDPLGHLTPWNGRIALDNNDPIDEAVIDEYLYYFPESEYIISYTAPTYEELGSITYKCAALNCGDEVTKSVIRLGVDFTVDMDYAIDTDEAFCPADSDVVAVDVYMNAYKTDVWGFNFDMYYNAAGMNFLGYVYHAGDVFGSHMVNNTTEDYVEYDRYDMDNDGVQNEIAFEVKDADGFVSVSGYTENALDGTKVDAAINGTVKIATLYFQIESYYEYAEMGIVDFTYAPEAYVSIYNAYMSNSQGADEECGLDSEGYIVTELLDINESGVFNIADLMGCYDIIKGVVDYDYKASADADKDGDVDLQDLDLMNKYLVGEYTDLDIYAALNWTAPEGFVAG